jgi:hypothetical protein
VSLIGGTEPPLLGRKVWFFSLEMRDEKASETVFASLIKFRAQRRQQLLQRIHLFLHSPTD